MDLMEKEKLEQKVEESRKSYAQNGHLKDFDEDFIRAEIKWETLLRTLKMITFSIIFVYGSRIIVLAVIHCMMILDLNP